MSELRTQRVLMRNWQEGDRETFFRINCEPAVRKHLGPITRARSDAMIDAAIACFRQHGWGRWALERRGQDGLIGHCGLMPVAAGVPTDAEAEIGWRLSEQFQGQGLAREAAEEALRQGFEVHGLKCISAFTTPANVSSWGLMERLRMRLVGEFDHPALPKGHALRRHVLYELRNPSSERGANPANPSQ